MVKHRFLTFILLIAVLFNVLCVKTVGLSSAFNHSSAYKESVYYKNLLQVKLTDSGAANIVNVAKSQVGYCEGNSPTDLSGKNAGNLDYCEYNYNIHNGANLPWCTSFVSWCAILAGEGEAIPKTGSTRDIYKSVLNRGGKSVSSTQVKPGDLVFYKITSTGAFCHVGIITGNDSSIEGNYSNTVKNCRPSTYIGLNGNSVSNGGITVLFLRPAYKQIPKPPNVSVTVSTEKSVYDISENVKISISAKNQSSLKVTINKQGSSTPVFSKENINTALLNFTAKETGKYTVNVTAKNENSTATAGCSFSVIIPEDVFFYDVSPKSFYADAVKWAAENYVTMGTNKNIFDPNGICTRAQAVTLLWRAAGCPLPQNSTLIFDDVTPDKYYYQAVQWAFEQGITDGTDITLFSPNIQCTRAQIITFIYRMHASTYNKANTPFSDVKESAYYAVPVSWAVTEGITNGSSKTTFSPNEGCTRAQIVTLLYRDFSN